MHRLNVSSGGRYPVLRALAILQLVSAVVVAIGGVVGAIYFANYIGHATSFADKLIISMGGLAATFFLVIFTLAFAELIKLLIDIEHNTRMAALGSNGEMKATPDGGRLNRGAVLAGEETAEGALLRGH
jgi:hypothetical protein